MRTTKMTDKKWFKVHAESTQSFYAFIEASSEQEALDRAEDGEIEQGDFKPDMDVEINGWEILDVTEVGDHDFADKKKWKVVLFEK